MKLIDMTVTDFMKEMKSDSPAPGGGSAAALAGSLGTALAIMVTELTFGKKKYADHEAQVKEIHDQLVALNEQLHATIDKDTEAFNEVSAVFSMPKDTDEEKAARREAMQRGLKSATKVPFEVMDLTYQSLKVAQSALGITNASAASDLGVASLELKTALNGAWLNVLINLDGIKDEAFVEEYKQKASDILKDGNQIADDIFQSIESSLK